MSKIYDSSPTYRSWRSMKTRCLNKNHNYYWRYGGRGITICKRWLHSFENFLADMGERPDGLTLDRKNNNGNYTPKNCFWATRKHQSENSINTVWIKFKGQRKSMSEWGRITGLGFGVIWGRLNRGWSIRKILTQPKQKRTDRRIQRGQNATV